MTVSALLLFGKWFIVANRRHVDTTRCQWNLDAITKAKIDWMISHHKKPTDTPKWDDLRPYLEAYMEIHGGRDAIPVCPQGGSYTIGPVNEYPKCSIGGKEHSIYLFPMPIPDADGKYTEYENEAKAIGLH